MEDFRLLSLREVATIASLGDWGDPGINDVDLAAGVSKKLIFVNSVIGRELLAFLPKHACEVGCNGLMLSAGELFVVKRALVPRALVMLEGQFQRGLRNSYRYSEWFASASIPESAFLEPRLFFHTWVEAFMVEGVNVLHGHGTPEALFGEGSLLTSWGLLQDFLRPIPDE